jgi:hypothetical protein
MNQSAGLGYNITQPLNRFHGLRAVTAVLESKGPPIVTLNLIPNLELTNVTLEL